MNCTMMLYVLSMLWTVQSTDMSFGARYMCFKLIHSLKLRGDHSNLCMLSSELFYLGIGPARLSF